MAIKTPHFTVEDAARIGASIYESDIKDKIEKDHLGEVVAIDLLTKEWEVAQDDSTAANRLEARLPDAQIWVLRVGHGPVRHFGFGRRVSLAR